MSPLTAKVFQSGNSKALRLPRQLNVTTKAYEVTPTRDGFIVTDPAARARRLRALRKLRLLPPLRIEWPRP
jgi:antitoxin VapB